MKGVRVTLVTTIYHRKTLQVGPKTLTEILGKFGALGDKVYLHQQKNMAAGHNKYIMLSLLHLPFGMV